MKYEDDAVFFHIFKDNFVDLKEYNDPNDLENVIPGCNRWLCVYISYLGGCGEDINPDLIRVVF